MDFKLNQNSLQVFQTIIGNHSEAERIRIVGHSVCINWRQIHANNRDKIVHLKEGLSHSIPIKEKIYNRRNFLKLTLKSLPPLNLHEVWSVSSKVWCENKYFHVPMMNFHLGDGIMPDEMCKAIDEICYWKKGVLLESGRYYHYYGDILLDGREWRWFLGQFLMPCVLVSPRYVGHALNDGHCSLRLTTATEYKPKIPSVVKIFSNKKISL